MIEMTDPDSPRSPVQKYRLTDKGLRRGSKP
ncbi:MAG: Fic family protein [Porticoccaceae bacterium]